MDLAIQLMSGVLTQNRRKAVPAQKAKVKRWVTQGILPGHGEVLVVWGHLFGAKHVCSEFDDFGIAEVDWIVLNERIGTSLS